MISPAFGSSRNAVVDSPAVLLGDSILTATTASVSFVVPTGYDILLMYWHDVYGNRAAAQNLRFRFNGDTGANYDVSPATFGTASSTTNGATTLSTQNFGDTGNTQAHVSGYAVIFNRASQEKVFIGHGTIHETGGVNQHDLTGAHFEAKWRNTSDEIYTILIYPNAESFVAGSRFTLLGIKTKENR